MVLVLFFNKSNQYNYVNVIFLSVLTVMLNNLTLLTFGRRTSKSGLRSVSKTKRHIYSDHKQFN